jgi:hypothetical protein
MAEGNPIGAVGYRRPPRNRQFKPGQSGNPTGRPKGAKNFATALAEELDAPITATENGKNHLETRGIGKAIGQQGYRGRCQSHPTPAERNAPP